MTAPGEIVRDRHGNALHPVCQVCGWRKGGVDCWDKDRCKCGHHAPELRVCEVVQFPRKHPDGL